ncbi:MAG: hypothetical protein QG575_890 [Euryarchaeota archaeon]|nr:hypothetical protein [Euryarchaeota archaeon]
MIALAAVCFLAAPAFCMPIDDGPGRQGHGAMFDPMNNLTAEELGNMTLGELKEMHHQARNNTTACLAAETGRNCSQWEMGMGPVMRGQDDDRGRFGEASRGMRGASPIMLLIDDLTVEDLGNMTVNQIKALSDKKMAELDNMTLAEIKLLQDKKAAERDNMTLNQLKQENKNMRQMAKILEVLGFGRHVKA